MPAKSIPGEAPGLTPKLVLYEEPWDRMGICTACVGAGVSAISQGVVALAAGKDRGTAAPKAPITASPAHTISNLRNCVLF